MKESQAFLEGQHFSEMQLARLRGKKYNVVFQCRDSEDSLRTRGVSESGALDSGPSSCTHWISVDKLLDFQSFS